MSGKGLLDALEVTVNGTLRQLASGTTLAELVTSLGGRSSTGVAVALNETLVPRSHWAGTALREHDRIEVLVPSQGG